MARKRMAQAAPIFRPDDYQAAHRRIKKLWDDGSTRIVGHAQERMKQRRIDINDIANVIRYGHIIEHKKPGIYWRYTLEGKAVDGDPTKIVCEINGMLVIITVF